MMSRTEKAEEVRSYFIALEDHINKYKGYIIEGLNKKVAKYERALFLSKILMLTTRFSKNTNQSIMLTTGFSEKWSGTFFYNIFFWTFIKCPFLKKIILSFKTCFRIIVCYCLFSCL